MQRRLLVVTAAVLLALGAAGICGLWLTARGGTAAEPDPVLASLANFHDQVKQQGGGYAAYVWTVYVPTIYESPPVAGLPTPEEVESALETWNGGDQVAQRLWVGPIQPGGTTQIGSFTVGPLTENPDGNISCTVSGKTTVTANIHTGSLAPSTVSAETSDVYKGPPDSAVVFWTFKCGGRSEDPDGNVLSTDSARWVVVLLITKEAGDQP
jgi:hypothetical protein